MDAPEEDIWKDAPYQAAVFIASEYPVTYCPSPTFDRETHLQYFRSCAGAKICRAVMMSRKLPGVPSQRILQPGSIRDLFLPRVTVFLPKGLCAGTDSFGPFPKAKS